MTEPIPPLELRSPYQAEISDALRDAMKAALAGDSTALDKFELEFLNLLVRIGEFFIKDANGTPHWWFARYPQPPREGWAPFVIARHRGYGPRGETALEWGLGEKCRRCDGRLRHMQCRICDGRWHLIEVNDAPIYTDLDGVLLDEG